MKYVYGPVPSRRLGQSLGVDPIPLKTCNWNCVYCQLGRTVPLSNTRREDIPKEKILLEVKQALSVHQVGEIDWITFVGSGEPTLHSKIGWLISEVKKLTELPVAVITNGALFYRPEVRRELLQADAVLPSLDAGTAWLYKNINRPHPAITFKRFQDGLVQFRKEYLGELWVEVMLVRNLNDTKLALEGIAEALRPIRPDEVHINLPVRPPAEAWVHPPDENALLRAQTILGEIAHVVHPIKGSFDLSGCDTLDEALISIITRHPMSEAELNHSLEKFTPGDVSKILTQLHSSGQAQVIVRNGKRFWSASSSQYPESRKSLATAPTLRMNRIARSKL